MHTRLAVLALLFVVLLLLSACRQGSPAAAAGDAAGAVGAVEASVKEWAIQLSSARAKAGKVKFTVKNEGALEHDFAIEGAGKVELVLPGETKTLELDLRPGTYKVICTLAGHKEAGMATALTVSE